MRCSIDRRDQAHFFKALVSVTVSGLSGGHGTVSMCVCGCHRNQLGVSGWPTCPLSHCGGVHS